MDVTKLLTLVSAISLLGCSDNEISPKVQGILDYADIGLVEVPIDEPINVYFIATVDGSDRRRDGSRMVTHTPFQLDSDTLIGIQRMSEDQLSLFVSDGSSTGLKWILDGIGLLEGTRMTGPNGLAYSGGARILFNQPPLTERGRPAIQVFMVSDPSIVPHYDIETNSYSETVFPRPSKAAEPMHHNVQYFVNNHRFGETNGCSGPVGVKGSLRCGHENLVSEIDWHWLGRSAKGDLYSVSRSFPVDMATETTEEKVVEYTGKETEIWQDKIQRIVFRPTPTRDEPNDTDNPVNAPENSKNQPDD